MNLSEFVDKLLTVSEHTYQDESWQDPDEYIVWMLTSDKSMRADGSAAESALRINVRIFTTRTFSTLPDKLKAMLHENDIAYEDMQYQYVKNEKTGVQYGVYSTFCEVE